MGIWWQISIFVLLILALSALRSRLVFEFASSSLLLFSNKNYGIWLYSLIFLPGTIIHELSHWIVAEILGVKTGEIVIIPDLSSDSDHEKLGSVQTASSGPLRSFAIGIAPFISGILILSVLGYFLLLGGYAWWQYTLLIYGIVVTSSSMLLSKEDRRSWLPTLIFFAIILLIIYQLGLMSKITPILYFPLVQINKILGITIALILGVIGISYCFRRIIEQVTGKKIMRRSK